MCPPRLLRWAKWRIDRMSVLRNRVRGVEPVDPRQPPYVRVLIRRMRLCAASAPADAPPRSVSRDVRVAIPTTAAAYVPSPTRCNPPDTAPKRRIPVQGCVSYSARRKSTIRHPPPAEDFAGDPRRRAPEHGRALLAELGTTFRHSRSRAPSRLIARGTAALQHRLQTVDRPQILLPLLHGHARELRAGRGVPGAGRPGPARAPRLLSRRGRPAAPGSA
jgi:hypothetical protein